MPDVYELAKTYRDELLALDRKAARRIAEQYRAVYTELQRRMKYATDELERLRADPKATPLDIDKALFKSERWRQAYNEARDELQRFNAVAKGITQDAQQEAIDLGVEHMDGLIKAAVYGQRGDDRGPVGLDYSFSKPDTAALQAMLGFSANGGPLANLFTKIAPEALDLARGVLAQGVALGTSPVVIGKQLAGPLGLPAWRGLTIARTETLRAYREAQRQTVLANDDVLEGWIWHSARDRRTCEVCWSMDGKMFPIVDGVPADVPGHQALAAPEPTAASKLAEAKQRWVEPGKDYAIRKAAENLALGLPASGQESADARLLMKALDAAPSLSGKVLYRGEQVGHIPEVGSSLRRILSSWGNAASADGYAESPAGAAVYGLGQSGHKVVYMLQNAKAVAMPEMDEYLSGGKFMVTAHSLDKATGITYIGLKQLHTYLPKDGL